MNIRIMLLMREIITINMFVVSGHLSIGLPTLSLPATLYLGITNEAGWQGIEVC
jgi:hypothetical protein